MEELLGIAKAYGVSAVEGMSGSGNISLDVRATGPIKNTDAMNFSGSGALQNASLKMPSLTQPLNVRNANLQFTQNSVNLTNLAASLGSTNASGNLSIANFQAPQLTFALSADKTQRRRTGEDHRRSSTQKAAGRRKPMLPGAWFPAPTLLPPLRSPAFCKRATGSGDDRGGQHPL